MLGHVKSKFAQLTLPLFLFFFLVVAACGGDPSHSNEVTRTDRPTETSEGLPGYILRSSLENMIISQTNGVLSFEAPSGSFVGKRVATADLTVKFWVVSESILDSILATEASTFAMAADPIAVQSPNTEGALVFEQSLSATGILVFGLVSDPQSNKLLLQKSANEIDSKVESSTTAFKDLEDNEAPVELIFSASEIDVSNLDSYMTDIRPEYFSFDGTTFSVSFPPGTIVDAAGNPAARSVYFGNFNRSDILTIQNSSGPFANINLGGINIPKSAPDGSLTYSELYILIPSSILMITLPQDSRAGHIYTVVPVENPSVQRAPAIYLDLNQDATPHICYRAE